MKKLGKKGAMGGHARTVVYEILGAFILIVLLVVLRPLFMGQVAQAGQAYNITYTDSSGVAQQQTITPDATLSTTQSNTIYTIVIFVVALIALFVIIMTVAGKI